MKESVTLIDHMGDDLSVVNAARVSFGKRVELDASQYDDVEYEGCITQIPILRDGDVKLINYLFWVAFLSKSIPKFFAFDCRSDHP